jgi:two-component system response regulator (stage 0 sporulation protein F)
MPAAWVCTLAPTILVVDDSPAMLKYFRTLLELDSYRVHTASNGLEALRRVREGFVPDLVLLDVQMPHLDGMQTLKYLLKLRPGLKVIMCSAWSSPGKVQQARLLGAQAYLTKPVQHLYLTAALENCLRPSSRSIVATSHQSALTFPSRL